MKKGERTRRRIVERSAEVFNTKGYFGSSMNDLMRETGLEKGGIYNHFGSKEELALEAFDYAAGIMDGRFRAALEGKERTTERLFAIVDVFDALVENPPVAGGCPVLNTAVESDDAHPALKKKAEEAMTGWLRLIGRIVKDGVRGGELREDTDPREVASVIVATLEGALMMSKLYEDSAHMRRAGEHLRGYIETLALTKTRATSTHLGEGAALERE